MYCRKGHIKDGMSKGKVYCRKCSRVNAKKYYYTHWKERREYAKDRYYSQRPGVGVPNSPDMVHECDAAPVSGNQHSSEHSSVRVEDLERRITELEGKTRLQEVTISLQRDLIARIRAVLEGGLK